MKVQACLRAFALCLAAGASGWIHVAEARTVFDASAALRAASDSAANPYTDAQGATWTVYGRTMANDGTTVPLAGQAVVTATSTAKGIGSYDGWCFVVGTAETEEKAIRHKEMFALTYSCLLVTANTRHFSRFDGLELLDWTK